MTNMEPQNDGNIVYSSTYKSTSMHNKIQIIDSSLSIISEYDNYLPLSGKYYSFGTYDSIDNTYIGVFVDSDHVYNNTYSVSDDKIYIKKIDLSDGSEVWSTDVTQHRSMYRNDNDYPVNNFEVETNGSSQILVSLMVYNRVGYGPSDNHSNVGFILLDSNGNILIP